MSGGPDELTLEEQRRRVRRAFGQGRRWWLRAALLLAVAAWGFARGGSFYLGLGAVMVLLAVMSASLGRTLRRQAQEAERKLALMEMADRGAGDRQTGERGTGDRGA